MKTIGRHNFMRYFRTQCIIIGLILTTVSQSQDLGANFNENIETTVDNLEQLLDSRVKWVRGFVNIPRYFLRTDGNNAISGVKSAVIKNHAPTSKFIQTKTSSNGKLHLMMSLKIPFENFSHLVPDPGTPEMSFLLQACKEFLISYDLGKNIEILVMGNEPEWENGGDSDAYRVFLNLFADSIAKWKQEQNWGFMVFAGSLNRVSELKNSTTIPAVIHAAQNNANIDGLDLHIHVANIAQARNDLKVTREDFRFNKKIIITEFSAVRALDEHVNDEIGEWGTENGYSSTIKVFQWLNNIAERAANNDPISEAEFIDFFHSRPWYPQRWYRTFYNGFKHFDVYAVTGRFVCETGSRNYNSSSKMWDLGAIYSGAFMGTDTQTGHYNASPLVYPEFKLIADSLYGTITQPEDQPELLFHFSFENDLDDNSANHYSLSPSNAPVYKEGKYGQAVELNGAGDYFDLTEDGILNPSLTPFTACAWVFNTQTPAQRTLSASGYDEEQVLHQLDGRVILQHIVNNTESTIATWIGGFQYKALPDVFAVNQWQHIAVVSNPVSMEHSFYVNGVLAGKQYNTQFFEYNKSGFRIGAHRNGIQSFWHGKIDEICLFKGLLNQNQIEKIMNNNFVLTATNHTTSQNNSLQSNSIYPNPAQDYIFVSNSSDVEQLTLFNISGEVVKYSKVSEKTDISMISPGSYLVSIFNKDGSSQTNKFFKLP